jgi:hypothetical protein
VYCPAGQWGTCGTMVAAAATTTAASSTDSSCVGEDDDGSGAGCGVCCGCPAGKFGVAANGNCKDCVRGFYSAEAGSTACAACPKGARTDRALAE